MTERGKDATPAALQPGEVLLVRDEFGVLVEGAASDVARTIEALLGRLPEGERSHVGRASIADAAAVASSGGAFAASSGEYLRLTADSLSKVSEYRTQLDKTGALRGYVRDTGGHFAGQLSFEPVSLAAEQALALQTMAVSLALRTAIANVQQAVERVEGKVQAIDRRIVSRTLGDVIGTHRLLSRLAEETSERAHLLEADWDSVASLGAKISQDLEALRDDAQIRAGDVSASMTVPKRTAKLEEFHQRGDLVDILNLILVLEQSLHLWEYLRLQRIRQTDPAHVESALAGARRVLSAQTELDRALVDQLTDTIERARTISPMEIHRVISRRGLDQQARRLHDAVTGFAEAGRLPVPEALPELAVPTVADTRTEVKDRAVAAKNVAGELGTAAWSSSTDILQRGGRQVGKTIRSRVDKVDLRRKSEGAPDD